MVFLKRRTFCSEKPGRVLYVHSFQVKSLCLRTPKKAVSLAFLGAVGFNGFRELYF